MNNERLCQNLRSVAQFQLMESMPDKIHIFAVYFGDNLENVTGLCKGFSSVHVGQQRELFYQDCEAADVALAYVLLRLATLTP